MLIKARYPESDAKVLEAQFVWGVANIDATMLIPSGDPSGREGVVWIVMYFQRELPHGYVLHMN